MVRAAPAYRRHRREFPKLNSVGRATLTFWTMKNAAVKLKYGRQRIVIQSQVVARESERIVRRIAPVWAALPARAVPAVSEEQHGLSHTAESKNFPELEDRLCLDLMVILKEQQQRKSALERKMKTAEVAPVRKRV